MSAQPPPKPSARTVGDVLAEIESASLHPARQLARRLVAEYRQGKAIDSNYRFEDAPEELRAIVYQATVRFHCHRSWWAVLRRLR